MFFLINEFSKKFSCMDSQQIPRFGGWKFVCSIKKYSFRAEICLSRVKFLPIAPQLCRQLYDFLKKLPWLINLQCENEDEYCYCAITWLHSHKLYLTLHKSPTSTWIIEITRTDLCIVMLII